MIRIVILADNLAADGFLSEHGLSLWIETDSLRILFDTGQGKAMAENAEKLGIRLDLADAVVLSHGHYDHTGGLPLVLSHARYPHLYCHPATFTERFSVRSDSSKDIGMQSTSRSAVGTLPPGRYCPVTEPFQLNDIIGITGPIPRETAFEDTGGPFYLDAESGHADPIADDMALWIKTSRGLVICAGCAHAGIVNTVNHVINLAGERRIHAVIGGMHLNSASEERIQKTIAALHDFSPELIVPCHCSGERAVSAMMDSFGEACRRGCAGLTLSIENTSRRSPD